MTAVATEKDVALDVVAALDMYSGLMGSEETTIEEVALKGYDRADATTVVLTLSNGEKYELRVGEVAA